MTATNAAVSVGTSAIAAIPAGWSWARIHNSGAGTVHVGFSSGVTTANGLPIAAGTAVEIPLPWEAFAPQLSAAQSPTVYLIGASGTNDCRVLYV